jgi:mRNA interferase RelE/StbE
MQMEWTVVLTGPARKSLRKIPASDHKRIITALDGMRINPFGGDVRKLQGLAGFRRRVGDWRIFFELLPERREVIIAGVERRTSTTY